MQISHAGRQTQALVNPHPKAPSAVQLALPGNQFGMPVPLTEDEIEDLINRFVIAAKTAQETGFTGVQIHAAHGYLCSQFLNPRANLREDQWGGHLDNRARFLLEIVRRTRAAVGPAFPVCVKLNSADFQKGGFEFEDSLVVAKWLEEAGVDMIEVSGGSYEQPKMMDMEGLEASEEPKMAASTAAREAYFVDFAKAMRKTLKRGRRRFPAGKRNSSSCHPGCPSCAPSRRSAPWTASRLCSGTTPSSIAWAAARKPTRACRCLRPCRK
jgi:2,4-dienoyl-CoA reductase-like NADH-dependent reductase (Old Yellow Enzyme family)